ncbi:MAG: hypothetical protein GF390_02385 [Candidatus Pacebacteria bacterium]|nr:hypothetical protein [Candidatus Paceibacterota bacterium]
MLKLDSFNRQHQAGQVGLVIILIMVVILTIGLSIATRTTQQTQISVEQAESSRVFNAAESGLEHALASIFNYERDEGELPSNRVELSGFDNANVQYDISTSSELQTHLTQGAAAELPFNNNDATITINWSQNVSCNDAAALFISVYYDDDADGIADGARHYALDGCDDRRNNQNSFSAPNSSGSDGYNFGHQLAITSDDLFARLKSVYNDTQVRVTGLPSTAQYNIQANAQNTQAGQETKSIMVERTIGTAPWVLDYALVSGNTIIKN